MGFTLGGRIRELSRVIEVAKRIGVKPPEEATRHVALFLHLEYAKRFPGMFTERSLSKLQKAAKKAVKDYDEKKRKAEQEHRGY